ncbi:hypothetical protein CsSME_00031817 [Camellia sinensis var. sinensis]
MAIFESSPEVVGYVFAVDIEVLIKSNKQMKLQIKLGVPRSLQQSLDVDKVKSVFP